MKKISLLLIFTLLSLMAGAQEALWNHSDITSPEIHANGSVTFRLVAPEAQKVELTGDFLPPQRVMTPKGEQLSAGVVAMTRQEGGLWEYTTDPLASELYGYSFTVDGLRVTDPNNVYLNRDIASLTNIFIIPGRKPDDKGALYSVQEVPHGAVTRCWYPSPTLKSERRLSVYTPAGYADSEQEYPVLYLLHGMGGDEEAWLSLGRAAQILDNLIAQGKARPMIVVMTNGNAALQAAPGETAQGLYKPTTNLPRTMEGSFESAFEDVINYIDSHYRTRAEKSGRAIAGLSMGGFHALHISRYYEEMFDYVGLFSAAIRPERAVNSPVYEDFEWSLKRQKQNGLRLYWIACGTEDFLWEHNKNFRQLLDEMAFPYTFRQSDGGHTWRNWRIYLSEFVPQLF
ncbi:MAG: esterase [Rikenellaceae bacterium]|nr:esterase [Rikenellaceae bacterium]